MTPADQLARTLLREAGVSDSGRPPAKGSAGKVALGVGGTSAAVFLYYVLTMLATHSEQLGTQQAQIAAVVETMRDIKAGQALIMTKFDKIVDDSVKLNLQIGRIDGFIVATMKDRDR